METFTYDMFRFQNGPPRVYAVGPSRCGKTTLLARLQSAGYLSWRSSCPIETSETTTFITIPCQRNQYFLLFKGALKFPCSRSRIPDTVVARVEALAEYEALLYDADTETLYVPHF